MSGKILRDVGKWCNPGAKMDLEVDLRGESHHLSPPPTPGMPKTSVQPAMMRLTTVYLSLFNQTGGLPLLPMSGIFFLRQKFCEGRSEVGKVPGKVLSRLQPTDFIHLIKLQPPQ
ncbi:hypothetical protein DPX16_22146 [Anabarilius grahami]|uniref:Uncharacterized protein n=1 Tax=Anabarilius grahami TaxID=495550 RepID=A0A3N0XQ71_ANAGA|nr:hypothetical protein DPX16_22146 [Anabarilius grahami]